MKNLIKIFFLLAGFTISNAQQTKVPSVKYEELEKRIQQEQEGDKLVVVNFWSTTCAPCVKELPHFMEVNKVYAGSIKMILVSLDRLADKEKVIKFIKNKKLTVEVILLDDIKRMNTWIPRFEKNWDGNIPVTLFYRNEDKVYFNDGEMGKKELENVIVTNLL
ncbi:hypothetical protein GCM10022217_35370 [Chryseobacterium ginsenosidimutans]|uniref:TlpA family protein disulfide reductase n=1 Tax=Chryseobacterium ginsenosidimutans TaxID=687846 RepID=UPI0031E1DC43